MANCTSFENSRGFPLQRFKSSTLRMKIISVVIAVIKNNQGKYLLTKRTQIDPEDKDFLPFVWNLPGGEIEKNESSEEALKREVYEELHVDLHKYKLLPKIFTHFRNDYQFIFNVFTCKLKDENQEIILNEETSEYGWFTIEEIRKLKTLPLTLEMILETSKINLDL